MVSCGGGGEDGNPDARLPRPDAETPDAGPKVYCVYDTDTGCGYVPEPVLPADVSLADQATLAKRYNPAQVMTGAHSWAVSVDYGLANGLPLVPGAGKPAELMSAEHDGRLNFSYKVDDQTYKTVVTDNLTSTDFSTLPTQTAGGRGLVYFFDTPGTATGPGYADETWTDTWKSIQGYTTDIADETTAPYPPHQYAHAFWLSKSEKLLAIQYWFYYPFDKFQNNHEGDWEHVNVVLDYESVSDHKLVFFQFSFHGRQLGVLAEDAYRIGDRTGGDGDHLVVFTGGDVCTAFGNTTWCGRYSGASYPYPGLYQLGYSETVRGTTKNPGRSIHANDFTVQLLPRKEDIDFSVDKNLSWYGLPFIFGEPITAQNSPAVMATNNNRAPVGPGPGHGEYDVGIEQFVNVFDNPTAISDAYKATLPAAWTVVNEPPAAIFSVEP